MPTPDIPAAAEVFAAPVAADAAVATAAPAPAAGVPAPRTWVQRRLLDPLLNLLRAGLSPGSLALTVGLGAAIGLIPALGLTTALAAAVALRLRLNVAATQLVSHSLSPLQLLLLLPLLRLGATLMGQGAAMAGLTLNRLEALFRNEPLALLRLLWRAELGALALWALGSVPLVLALYFGLKPLFARFVREEVSK